MKRIERFIGVLLLAGVLALACTTRPHYDPRLVQADRLLTVCPDSALRLLEVLPADSLYTEADRAYYALLLTQARDKNYLMQTNDSLIRVAVCYFDSVQDINLRARAYYLWGSICRDRNDQVGAIRQYLIAAYWAEECGDLSLQGRIYANAGFIHYLAGLYEESYTDYQRVEQVGKALRDTMLLCDALTMQGKIATYLHRYREASEKLRQARPFAEAENRVLQANWAAAFSTLCKRTGQAEEALVYAKRNLALQYDTVHCYRSFLELGDAYFLVGKHDSALIFLNQCVVAPYYDIKRDVYMLLADVAKAQGKTELSLEMERLYSAYQDSARHLSPQTQIVKVEEQVRAQLQHSLHQTHLQSYRWGALLFFLVTVGIVYGGYGYYRRRLRKQKTEASQKEAALSQENQLLKDEIEQSRMQLQTKHNTEIELAELEQRRFALLRQNLIYSEVYAKIQGILADHQANGRSKESLTSDEWERLALEVDQRGVLREPVVRQQLDDDEIHYCCLLLADFSIKEEMQLLQISRATIYRMNERICHKLGIDYQSGALKKWLTIRASGANTTL